MLTPAETQVGDLSPAEAAERDSLLARGGRLAAVMRAAEADSALAGAVGDLWRWAIWLVMIRGYRASTTGAKYAAAVADLLRHVAARGQDWRELALEEIEAWLRSLYVQRRTGASHRSVAVSATKSFYRWRGARGRGRDCSFGLTAPKVPRKVPRKFTGAELKAFFAAIKAHAQSPLIEVRDRALLLVLLASGLRREEVSTLRQDEVSIEGRIGVLRVTGKGAKEREVPIEGPVVRALVEWLDARRKDGRATGVEVFSEYRSGKFGPLGPGGVERVVKRYAKLGNVRRWGVHVFRVTFATLLYDDGVDIERIRILMGHESIETTRRYISVSQRNRKDRLKPHRQHAALGTAPDGMPAWAKQLESQA